MGVALILAAGILGGLQGHGAPAAVVHEMTPILRRTHCLRALTSLAADTAPLSDNFTPADCPSGTTRAVFRYDGAHGATRLIRAVAQGEIVAAYPEFGGAKIMPGQTLQLVITYGAARVERQVEALQSARPGQRLFVRSNDGQILSVRYEAISQ